MTKPILKVGTHHGKFHADDVFGYVVLLLKFYMYKLLLTRTRDPKLLETLDLVFDVGGGKFDHHTTDKVYRDGIPYAAFGLLWKEFGHDIIKERGVKEETEIVNIFNFIDKHFIQGIDALDNGVKEEGNIKVKNIAEIIEDFNPPHDSNDSEDEAFMKAVDFARVVFENALNGQLAVYRAKSMIKEAYENREQKEVLVLEKNCDWHQTLLELDTNEEVLFVVAPDRHEGYRIQVVPVELDSFTARKDLPAAWSGKRDGDLDALTGVTDSIFCHPALFLAGAWSKESIMHYAKLAVEYKGGE